jgi:hypothetical protein
MEPQTASPKPVKKRLAKEFPNVQLTFTRSSTSARPLWRPPREGTERDLRYWTDALIMPMNVGLLFDANRLYLTNDFGG